LTQILDAIDQSNALEYAIADNKQHGQANPTGWAKLHFLLTNADTGVLRGFNPTSLILSGTKIVSRQRDRVLKILVVCSKYSDSKRPPIPGIIKRGSRMHVGYQEYIKTLKASREAKRKEEEAARQLRHEIEGEHGMTGDSNFNVVARNPNANLIRHPQQIQFANPEEVVGLQEMQGVRAPRNPPRNPRPATSAAAAVTPARSATAAATATLGSTIVCRSTTSVTPAALADDQLVINANNGEIVVLLKVPIPAWGDMSGHKLEYKQLMAGAMRMISRQLGEARNNVLPQVYNVPTSSSKLEAIEKKINALKKLERNAQDDADDGRLERFKRKRKTLEDELFDQL
jgi:hypothetical protein